MSEKIYEVIDATNDEMYFPLGIFSTLEQAKAAVLKQDEDRESAITEYGSEGEYETVKVLERELNMINGNHGKQVFELSRRCVYIEETDSNLWETVSDERETNIGQKT